MPHNLYGGQRKFMSKLPSLEEMLKAGMHFGHRTHRWHPKMKPYIFAAKNGIYVIDLEKSREKLSEALDFMSKLIKGGKTILFVGTKSQIKEPMRKMAEITGQPYIVGKWLGGYLTNFTVVKKSVKKYQELVENRDAGKLDKYTKKERLDFDREIKRLHERVGGLTNLNKMPDAVFVWDIKEESTAVAEATKKNIPIIGVCDTNVNPELVTYPIPANDDATKTVKLLIGIIQSIIIDAKKDLKN